MDYLGDVSKTMIKAEIETDLRRAVLGSEQLEKPMLTYLLRMAIAELRGESDLFEVKTNTEQSEPQNLYYVD